MVKHSPEWDTQTFLECWGTDGSPNLSQITRPSDSQQKMRTYQIVDHRVKIKESKKRNKYQDLARELKKLWNMKVTGITIMVGAFGIIPIGLVKGLEDLGIREVTTIQTTTLLRLARIMRRVLETWGDLLSFWFQWETIS